MDFKNIITSKGKGGRTIRIELHLQKLKEKVYTEDNTADYRYTH